MKINNELEKVFRTFEGRYYIDGTLNKSKVIEDLTSYDRELLQALLGNEYIKSKYSIKIDNNIVLKVNDIRLLLEMNNYWESSYTKYLNKIGLTNNGRYLDEISDVILDFPFKDTVLKASMSKEDNDKNDLRPDEPFLNEIIAQDEIDVMLDKKIMKNIKKIDKDGNHEINSYNFDDNLIIKGNNLLALHSLKERFGEKIKFIYIDPPFNTGKDSFLYNDKFSQSSWLTFMKNRLEISKDLLTSDGNIAIHIDWNQSHYLKVLADSIFGKENFLNEVIWSYEKWTASSKNLQKNHDTILIYSKNKGKHHFNIVKDVTENLKEKYEKGYLLGGGGGSKGLVVYDRNNKKVQELIATGKYNVVYAEADGKPLSDVWYIPFINPVSHERTGFNSQKPEKLIKRLLDVFTDEGDLVLDYHLGSGTTCAVAHKLGRRYIGVEQMDYIQEITIPRLQRVISGEQGGISKDIDWQGGGSFIYAELMEKNIGFIKEIYDAEKPNDLRDILNRLVTNAEIDFRVDLNQLKNTINELSFEEQKKALIKVVEKNQLYYNYSEINDISVRDLISDTDYAFNLSFYEGDNNE